jgi:type IV secretion system protein VirD4
VTGARANRATPANPPAAGVEALGLAAGGACIAVALIVWLGAQIAALVSGGDVRTGVIDALPVAVRLVADPGDPAAAWGPAAEGLPGPLGYWGATIAAAAATTLVCVGLWRAWRMLSAGDVRRFGAAVDARVARKRDVDVLTVESTQTPQGRLLLGRLAPRGPLLATEDRERHPLTGRAGRRQGDRGSVALIGPTRTGKTVLASAGIVAWDGPVVALSVKRDLYNATAAARAGRGEVAVFDPGAVTGMPTARWSPLRDVTTASAALRAGRALAQAIPRAGVQGGDFWAQHGEAFIGAYLSVAGLSQLLRDRDGRPREPLTIEQLATWAYMGAGITEPVINELVRAGLADHQPLEVRLLARNAATKLMALHREDPRIRGSIFATARLAFDCWAEPSVAHSASHDPRHAYDSASGERWERKPRWLDLDWLMGTEGDGRATTLYLCAPDTEFARLAPTLGGLLGDLREQIHAWDVAGRTLHKPLLLVIDEAGQLELQWLPGEVSTIAGLGAMIVTCWQSKAQITHRYGTLADAVLGGHRSKVFFAGTDDPSTVEYLSGVVGTEHVAQRSWSANVRDGHTTVSEQPQREALLPAHVVRQMRRLEGVLVHGSLPPVHMRAVLWWEDPRLSKLVPTNRDGRPAAPPDVETCPLTDEPADDPSERPDGAAVKDSAAYLPNAVPGKATSIPESIPPPLTKWTERHRTQARSVGAQAEREPVSQAAAAGDVVEARLNRVAGVCERCGRWVKVGTGRALQLGQRDVVVCHPHCTREPDDPRPLRRIR